MAVEICQDLLKARIIELRQTHDQDLVDLVARSKAILEKESFQFIADALPGGAAARIVDNASLTLKAAEIEFHRRYDQLGAIGMTYSDLP